MRGGVSLLVQVVEVLRSAGVEGSRLQVLDMGDIHLGALSLEVLLLFLLLILILILILSSISHLQLLKPATKRLKASRFKCRLQVGMALMALVAL